MLKLIIAGKQLFLHSCKSLLALTVISIGRSPKTICAPTSSDAFRAARNCNEDITYYQNELNIYQQHILKLPHHQKGG